MSQHQTPMSFEAQPSNGLAIAGFICSLVGLLGAGLLAPIGLIISLVALGKPGGRGFAIAGIILGLLGLCGWIVAFLAFGAVILAALGIAAAGVVVLQAEGIELTADMAQIAIKVEEYERANGAVPDDLSVLTIRPSAMIDPWGNNYRYVLIDDEPGFDIISNGEDGQPETEDDIFLSQLDEYWEGAWEDFEQQKRDVGADDADAGDAEDEPDDAAEGDESGGDADPGDDAEGGGDE